MSAQDIELLREVVGLLDLAVSRFDLRSIGRHPLIQSIHAGGAPVDLGQEDRPGASARSGSGMQSRLNATTVEMNA
jgi:hypothetical protein